MIRHIWIRQCLLSLIVIASVYGLSRLPVSQRLELQWLDLSFKIIRTLLEPRENNDVVIIGFDEKSLNTFGKPFALLHDEYAEVLNALLSARPRAVAVDLIFPKQEYGSLIPGGLQRLGASIYQLRSQIPLFIGTQPIPPQTTAEQIYAAMAGVNGQVLLNVPEDFDGVLRRVDNKLSSNGAQMPILAASVVHSLGEKAVNGIVDFTLGKPFSYVPAELVIHMLRNKDSHSLSAQFRDKVVLVGAVLPDQDRQLLPVVMAEWETSNKVPGIIFQAQAIRSMLKQRMISENRWLGYVIAALGFIMIFSMRKRLIVANCIGAGLGLGVIVASVLLLANAVHIAVIFSLLIFMASLVAINLDASINSHKERLRIRNIFSGYVSPAILETILNGDLKNGLASTRKNIAFLFSDMRGFTAFSSTRSPEDVIAFLNEYYTAMTPVFHRYGGTVDKFSGDGVMVFFGAPQESENPARDAILAGSEMLQALEIFNEKIAKKGLPAVAIGVGIAYGEAIIGNVGSADRHDYAATGAVVNLAAHVQQYCKSVPYSLLIEESAFVHANLSQEASNDFIFLGAVKLEKHGDTRLVGLRIKGVEYAQH